MNRNEIRIVLRAASALDFGPGPVEA